MLKNLYMWFSEVIQDFRILLSELLGIEQKDTFFDTVEIFYDEEENDPN